MKSRVHSGGEKIILTLRAGAVQTPWQSFLQMFLPPQFVRQPARIRVTPPANRAAYRLK